MKFPNPHDVKGIPGTEGWERMYPYQYQFVTDDLERKEYEEQTFWFYDGLHYPEPIYPFDTIWDEAWYLALSQFGLSFRPSVPSSLYLFSHWEAQALLL
jgi:pyruvate,water dikinase